MSQLTLMLIRHAEKPKEKPNDPDLGAGVTPQGVGDEHSLVVRGWQRAGTWAALFASGSFGPDFPRPDFVYAADPDKVSPDDGAASKRPYETIIPLCERLHIDPIRKFGVGDEAALVGEVQKLTGVVLISWEHKRIVQVILPELIKGQTMPHVPGKWDRTRFDVVLRFDRALPTAGWSFRQLFPRLLSGDRDDPLS